MTVRCGSYPLMNLAQDFGLDYGDILLWADYMRRWRGGLHYSAGYMDRFTGAAIRIDAALTAERYDEVLTLMVAHADARWGKLRQNVRFAGAFL